MSSLFQLSSTSILRASVLALTSGLLVAAALVPAEARAQLRPDIPDPSDAIYEVRLSDGTVVFARIVAVDQEKVALTTIAGGRLEIERSQIVTLSPAKGEVVNGEFWNEDPSATRLFFTATGRTLRQRESYAGTYLAILPFGAVGLADRVMIGAGVPITLGRTEPSYLAPKVLLVNGPGARISLGTLNVFHDDGHSGIAYGVGTFGSTDEALSVGIGYFFGADDLDDDDNKVGFMFGGEIQTSRRIKLISENLILPPLGFNVFSGGLRVIGDRLATEVAVAVLSEEGDSWCCLPLVNFTYALGN